MSVQVLYFIGTLFRPYPFGKHLIMVMSIKSKRHTKSVLSPSFPELIVR